MKIKIINSKEVDNGIKILVDYWQGCYCNHKRVSLLMPKGFVKSDVEDKIKAI